MDAFTPDTIKTFTVTGGLLTVIWLGYTKKWVFGWHLTECEARAKDAIAEERKRTEEERQRTEEWKSRCDKATAAAELGLQVAKERRR